MMDVLGHDDIDHAELYSREASQVRLAVQGMDRVVRLVTRKPLLGGGEPVNKPLINNDNGGPGGSAFSKQNQSVSGWLAKPYSSYSLVWSGEPKDDERD
jgi:hypothetical protein